MEKLQHNIECTDIEKSKSYGIATVSYCTTCGCFASDKLTCDQKGENHTLIEIAFILSDGKTIQIRQYCKKCCWISPRSLSHSKYDLNKLPHKRLDEYHDFYENEYKNSLKYFDKLRAELDIIKRDFNKGAYEIYLQSDHWTELKTKVMERDRHICQICGEEATEVHHLTYAHRDNEHLFELVALCHNCHETHY